MANPVIIDTHMHLFADRSEGERIKRELDLWEYGVKDDVRISRFGGDVDDALEAIKEAGASQAILVNFFDTPDERKKAEKSIPRNLGGKKLEEENRRIEFNLGKGLIESNIWACGLGKEHEAIIPFINVDPNLIPVEATIEHIHDMVGRGAQGIKIHPAHQRFYMHDDRMIEILRCCVDLKLPIVSHSGPDPEGARYAEPRSFAKTMDLLPDLNLILAHLGGGSWWQTLEFAVNHPQVNFDCSEVIQWTGSQKGPSDLELAQLIVDIGPERVVMGTDFPWYDIDHTVEKVVTLPLLSTEEKEAILGTNAQRILRL